MMEAEDLSSTGAAEGFFSRQSLAILLTGTHVLHPGSNGYFRAYPRTFPSACEARICRP